MRRLPTRAAAALAFLILMFSCLALGMGLTTPQVRGGLFWLVSAGFAIQALASAAWLVRLVAERLGAERMANATDRGTRQPSGD
jgi:membrane protein implicated in regulation of membrane protease activity